MGMAMRNELLAAYLADNAVSATDFAERVGCAPISVHRYINGERVPDPDIMDAIARVTDGAVPHESWTPAIVAKHRARRKRSTTIETGA